MSKQFLRGTTGNADLTTAYSQVTTSGSIYGYGPPVWIISGPGGSGGRNNGSENGWAVQAGGVIVVPTDPGQAPLGEYQLIYYDNYVGCSQKRDQIVVEFVAEGTVAASNPF